MPIPFLFIGIGAVTGMFGVGKSIKAGADQKDANETNQEANRIVERASRKIDTRRKECGKSIDRLGKCKIEILDQSIKTFITEFEKTNIKVESEGLTGLNELQKIPLDKKEFAELKQMQSMATSMAGGVASGALAGALTGFGAYGAAGAFATASTGTAISALSGAAATNATLAFFGGGALNATAGAAGLGMAGGSAVLGGLVAGPALAVLGVVVGAKASANRDRAYSNYAKAKAFEEEMNAACDMCVGIRRRAAMLQRFLLSLNSVFEPLVYEMAETIKQEGPDYERYSPKGQQVVMKAMKLAAVIKTLIGTPLLDENGNLTVESELLEEMDTPSPDKNGNVPEKLMEVVDIIRDSGKEVTPSA